MDNVERGNTKNLNQLIEEKTSNIRDRIDELQLQVREINRKIIKDEEQLTKSYKDEVKANLLGLDVAGLEDLCNNMTALSVKELHESR